MSTRTPRRSPLAPPPTAGRGGLWLLFWSALGLFGAVSAKAAELTPAALNGVWIIESASLNGERLDPGQVPMIELELKDGAYTFRGTDTAAKGKFTLDATKTPAWMDVEETDGPNVGQKLEAIAELTATGWRACYALGGSGRPKEFKAAADTGQFQAEYRLKPGAGAKPLRALLITGGCCHDYPNQRTIIPNGIAARANVEWTVVFDSRTGTTGKLEIYQKENWAAGYDVVVHNECFSDEKELEWLEKILKPHRDGVPAVLIHCTMHCYRAPTDEWFKFCGVTSHRHGSHFAHEVTNLKPEHPIMKGFPAVWMTPKEELYNIAKVWDTATPLASSLSPETKNQETDIWINTYGKGRVFGTTIGHYNATMQEPLFLDVLARGLLWACDKLGDDGKPKAGYAPAPRAAP